MLEVGSLHFWFVVLIKPLYFVAQYITKLEWNRYHTYILYIQTIWLQCVLYGVILHSDRQRHRIFVRYDRSQTRDICLSGGVQYTEELCVGSL